MDTNGYVKLVDFGLAKQLLSGKTWTLCGTPDYLAPEIILNEGHDLAVDYWALGVLIFEMVVGAPPFYAEDPMEVYEKILSGNPPMPTFFTRNLSDLIKKLLRSQQGKRLGNTRGGTAAVVKHKWFSSFDWASLENGEAKAPYVPSITAKDDVTNFDKFDDGDAPVRFYHYIISLLYLIVFLSNSLQATGCQIWRTKSTSAPLICLYYGFCPTRSNHVE
jgi:serine/threonine protein kinase